MAIFKDFNLLANKILVNADEVLSDELMGFNARIMQSWAVDTGKSRRGWLLEKIAPAEWRYSNDVDYSPIVWYANRNVTKPNNQVWWSGGGGEPMLDRVIDKIQRRLVR